MDGQLAVQVKLKHNNTVIKAVDWKPIQHYYRNQIIDIIFNVEMNYWKNSNNLQLSIAESRKSQDKVTINVKDNSYNCRLKQDNTIEIVNRKGNIISSVDNLEDICKGNEKSIRYLSSLIEMASMALGTSI